MASDFIAEHRANLVSALTPEEAHFCQVLIMENLSKADAYRVAYKPVDVKTYLIGSRGYEIAKRPRCLDYMAFLQDEIHSEARLMTSEIQEKIRISGGDLLQELANIVVSDITDYLDWDDDGPNIHSSESLTPAQAKALQSIKFKTVEKISVLGQITRTTNVEFKLWNKLDAARQLTEIYSMSRRDPDEESAAKAPPPIPMNLDIQMEVIADGIQAAVRAGFEVLGLPAPEELIEVEPEAGSENGAQNGH